MTQAAAMKRRKRSKKFKFLVLLVLAAAVSSVVYFNLQQEKPAETFATRLVERGELVHKLAETGSIELVRTVEVKSTVSGEIRTLPVEAGDWVEKDQLMAVIEPDLTQSLQLYQKRSAVDQARINLEEQEKDFSRKKALFDAKMLAVREYEEVEVRLVRARNSLRLAQLELEIQETKANLSTADGAVNPADLDEVRMLAPISGIIIRREVEIGEVVASGTSLSGGMVLFEIGDPSRMIVRADIAEIDIGQLHSGQEAVIVVDAYPDTTYEGRVRWIAPVGQKKQGGTIVTFEIKVEILDREPRLRQGMSCDLDIIFTRRDSALYLPMETVVEVFDDEEGQERPRGKRGRFIAYAVSPDSTGVEGSPDTLVVPDVIAILSQAEAAQSDSTAGVDTVAVDSAAVDTTDFELQRFAEVELQVGLEISTRIEVLSGLEQGDRVAADPQLVRRKKESPVDKSKDE